MPLPQPPRSVSVSEAPAPTRSQALQYRFAAHIRDDGETPLAAIEERRLKIYRELFYNNVEDCLSNAFPVLRKLSGDAAWHRMVRDFFARHRCAAPLFHRVPEEFLAYLKDERGERPEDPPFLRDLAHYEWVELALSISPLELTPALADPNGDLLEGCPMMSPLAWLLAYTWPVHLIGPDHIPAQPPAEPTYLVVNRDRQDRVRFMALNPVVARLLNLIEAEPDASGRTLLLRIAGELGHPDPEAIVQQGAQMLAQLRERDIVIGTRRP